jgi:hypothetical protein
LNRPGSLNPMVINRSHELFPNGQMGHVAF